MQIQAITSYNTQPRFGSKFLSAKDKQQEALTYIIRNRRGYQDDLYKNADSEVIEGLKMTGLIKTGHTLKHETYSITDLGDRYYKECYGTTSYYLHRAAGFINKLVK